MCGISGFINKDNNKANPEILAKMLEKIKHRGPEDEGVFIKENVALGHRRLKIIDLEHGHQPFVSEDGRVIISYNGECYNFLELKKKYLRDEKMKSHSDTEVVLKLYEKFGEDFFLLLNGMFAIAILDFNKNRLILARDRYGIKPLYYYLSDSILIFSSEIKSILEHPDYKREINYNSLLEYFTFQNIFSDNSLFKEVKKIEHGCYICMDLSTFNIKYNRYWDFNFNSTNWKYSEEQTVEILQELFKKAVNRQMISDVPVGSYLSGGIDSAAITAIAAKNAPRLMTFTCGFDLSEVSGLEMDFDERRLSEQVSSAFFTKHHEIILNSNDLKWCIDDVTYHLDEPVLGMSYPNYYISELAGKFVKVVLSGTGGDELFAGYPWRYYHTTDLGKGIENYVDSYYKYWQRMVNDEEIKELFSNDILNKIDLKRPFEVFKSILSKSEGDLKTEDDYVNKALYFESKTFLQGLFSVEDKLNMAHSVEVRVPFMDNDLVDAAMQIPASYKIKNIKNIIKLNENETSKVKKYYLKSNDGKNILRNTFRSFLPQTIIDAKKQGFSAPEQSWCRYSRKSYIEDIINDKDNKLFEIINREVAIRKLYETVEGKKNNRLFLWSIISLSVWMKRFF